MKCNHTFIRTQRTKRTKLSLNGKLIVINKIWLTPTENNNHNQYERVLQKLETKKKQHHKTSQLNQTRNLTITSSRECVCLEANWPLVHGFCFFLPALCRTESKVNRKRTDKKPNKQKLRKWKETETCRKIDIT